MALLDVRGLTVRFGGLTAVNKVDLRVDEGTIVSVIGPNGAGKTTVFNAITAISEPAEGAVRCRGREMRLPFRGKVVAGCALVGMLTAGSAVVVASGVDLLWKATIKANYVDASRPFPAGRALGDFRRQIAGRPRVEKRGPRFQVVGAPGEPTLGSFASEEEARAELARVDALLALEDPAQNLERLGDDVVVLSEDRTRTLASFASAAEAAARFEALAAAERAARAGRVRTGVAAAIGLLVGGLGAASVWWRSRRAPHIVAAHDIARTFQNIRLFQQMTVLENVLVGMHRHLGRSYEWLGKLAVPAALAAGTLLLALGLSGGRLPPWLAGLAAFGLLLGAVAWMVTISLRGALSRRERADEDRARRGALEILDFVGLRERAGAVARNLPYGDQRRLEIARALAARPTLLLLDEPAAGMNPAEAGDLMALIRRIRESGVGVLLIEHHMRVVMGISDRIAVLDYGSKIAEGTPDEVRADPRVIAAYLGTESA